MFFIPPALYYGGIGALGAGARFLNSPTGQNVVRGGINLLNKGVNKIANTTLGNVPQYLQHLATGSKFSPKGGWWGNVAVPSMTAPYLADPKEGLNYATYFTPYATEALNQLTGGKETGIVSDLWEQGGNLIDALWGETEEETKKEKKKEKKKNKEPSINDLPLDAKEAKERKEKKEKKKNEEDSEEASKNLKKGGYVKKQRKRKHYKASGFVKMKKSKKKKYV